MNTRILLAEDNQLMAGLVRTNLERAGLDVSLAYTGREAIDRLRDGGFDAVITDFQMPEGNGEDVCRFMRADDRYQQTPLILCSAKGYELDLEEMTSRYDLAAVVFKPFSPRDLVSLIRSLLINTELPA
jgi:DNA-binding response OmpR family regulator